MIDLQPDRLSIFSYAHQPERYMLQRRINPTELPSAIDKLAMLQRSIEQLTDAGYRYIGMDHFALPDDELAIAQEDGTLQRNFQGYTTHGHCDLIGLGVSAISQVGNVYCQNASDVTLYQQSIDHDQLATTRGLRCNEDDRIRGMIIQRLICDFELDVELIERSFGIDFRHYFQTIWPNLEQMHADGLIELTDTSLSIRPAGRLLARAVCMQFDQYLLRQTSCNGSRIVYA